MVAVEGPRPPGTRADNGFASVEAMDAAHGPVIEAAATALAGGGR